MCQQFLSWFITFFDFSISRHTESILFLDFGSSRHSIPFYISNVVPSEHTFQHLDFNNITTVTKGWLYGLTSLHQLSLSYNSISIIEQDGWEFCQQLVDL
uniref:Uncharacterized protein n=1 Tax=Timema monikensis TaxID=170555 RepID=A0A7R9HLR6_9NEOP|nr:unnamed protein product [Timema monikensis]